MRLMALEFFEEDLWNDLFWYAWSRNNTIFFIFWMIRKLFDTADDIS